MTFLRIRFGTASVSVAINPKEYFKTNQLLLETDCVTFEKRIATESTQTYFYYPAYFIILAVGFAKTQNQILLTKYIHSYLCRLVLPCHLIRVSHTILQFEILQTM